MNMQQMDVQNPVPELKSERVQGEAAPGEEMLQISLKSERVQESLTGGGTGVTVSSVYTVSCNQSCEVTVELRELNAAITLHDKGGLQAA